MANQLDHLAYKQNKLAKLLKKLDVVKKEIRAEIFQEANEHYEAQDWLLPTTSWLVPVDFFEKAEITHEEFIKTRFPQWDVITTSETDEGIIFVLRKKKEFMPWSYSSDEFEISRSVAEITPEIDWETMKKVDPDFFKMFAKPKIDYELDVSAFNLYMNSHPDFAAQPFLVRYAKHKAPTLRVLSKEKKGKEDG